MTEDIVDSGSREKVGNLLAFNTFYFFPQQLYTPGSIFIDVRMLCFVDKNMVKRAGPGGAGGFGCLCIDGSEI